MATTMQQMDQRELMTLQHYLKEYGQQAEVFVGQLELLENGRMEAHAAIEALEGMLASEDGTVLLQIGGGVSVRAKVVEPDKVLISIGAEVVVERSNKDAIEYLKRADHRDGSFAEESIRDARPPPVPDERDLKAVRVRIPAGRSGRARKKNNRGFVLMFGGLKRTAAGCAETAEQQHPGRSVAAPAMTEAPGSPYPGSSRPSMLRNRNSCCKRPQFCRQGQGPDHRTGTDRLREEYCRRPL